MLVKAAHLANSMMFDSPYIFGMQLKSSYIMSVVVYVSIIVMARDGPHENRRNRVQWP